MTSQDVGRRVRPYARFASALSALVVGLAIAVPQPAGAEPAGLRAYLNRLIVSETLPESGPYRELKEWLAPRLAAAVREDENKEMPALDYEPICQCQDAEGMKMRVRSIRGNDKAAIAELENRFTGKTVHVTLHLTHGAHGWRIADISTKEDPSLLHDLEESNRQH